LATLLPKHRGLAVPSHPRGSKKETMEHRQFKETAQVAATYLAEHGIEVPHTRMLEAISRAFGERNWSTLSAQLKAAKSPGAAPGQAWDPDAGPMTQAQYVERGGACCPFCGSDNVEADGPQADGPLTWDDNTCHECAADWKSSYSLTGFFAAQNGETDAQAPDCPTPSCAQGPQEVQPNLDKADSYREETVDDLVDDVMTRARRHQFSHYSYFVALSLARESNEQLDADATERELQEAAMRLA
jgi:hypothetical protein